MDEDVLKTLQNIEKLLKSSAMFSGKSSIASAAQKAKDALKSRFQRDEDRTYKAVSSAMKGLDSEVSALQKSMGSLNKEVYRSSTGFSALTSQMAKFMASIQPQAAATTVTNNLPGNKQQNTNGLAAVNTSAKSAAGRMLVLAKNSAIFGLAMEGLGAAAKKITEDMFGLARVGLGTTDSLLTLYKGALLSGVSLEDYTKIIKENITFASRAGDLAKFDEITSAANAQLRALGVFGGEAKDLQATLANSMTMMGVSQGDLTSQIKGQIDVFAELRKSTNMTAHEFGQLVSEMTGNTDVQKELLGMAPDQRNARMQELIALRTTGERLGLAANESKKLADAMIAARNETVKGRFESAGRIRQLGAFLGMGAEADRAAQLQMKGRRRSREENEELRVLSGRLSSAAQQRYETGGIGSQAVLDAQLEKLGGTAIGKLMEANNPAELATQSGAVANEDFGKSVGLFGQFVGQLMTYGKGITASPLGALAAGAGVGILAAFRGAIFGPILGAIQSGSGAVQAATKPLSSLGGMFSSLGGFAKGLAKSFGILALVTVPLEGIFEAFTGKIRDVLDPQGGLVGTIGGVLVAMLGAIPNTIIGALEFIFGENLLRPVQNMVDIISVTTVNAFKWMFSGIFSGLEKLLSWLPDDSGLKKMITSASQSLSDSVASSDKVIAKLQSDSGTTLDSLAESNKKQSDATVKDAKAATTKVQQAQQKFNNVQYGTAMDPTSIINEARAIAANPQVQVPNQIKPPETLNTERPETKSEQPQATESDTVVLLRSILAVLTRSATAEELQAELAALQLQQSKPRPDFASAEERANKLLRNMRGQG